MNITILLVALLLAVASIVWIWINKRTIALDNIRSKQVPYPMPLRVGVTVGASLVFIVALLLSSIVYIGDTEIGLVIKKFGGGSLPSGAIVALNGEDGPQAQVLTPGYKLWYWPWQYQIDKSTQLLSIPKGSIGEVEALDGAPLPDDMIYAPPWEDPKRMLDAESFLSAGYGGDQSGDIGYKGPQSTVLVPGTYRYNPRLFRITQAPLTNVDVGHVKVVKSNVGDIPAARMTVIKELREEEVDMTEEEQAIALDELRMELTLQAEVEGKSKEETQEIVKAARLLKTTKIILKEMEREVPDRLANKGQRGIWREPLYPRQYYLHNAAYEMTDIQTLKVRVAYSGEEASEQGERADLSLSPIQVLTKDGFKFPVDVRVIYHIEPEDAPLVVSTVGDDEHILKKVMTPAVRSIFRNNAQGVTALAYVKQRLEQQKKSTLMIRTKLAPYGISVDEVLIGDVGGDTNSIATLLATQTNRQLAKQQQITYMEQQKAAEKRKALTKTEQEAEEEKKLAQAEYAVKIAAQKKDEIIIQAQADAEKVTIAAAAEAERIKAIGEAEADKYLKKAAAIGKQQVAVLEALELVASGKIRITPEVMVSGGDGGSGGTMSALMGTMLGDMVTRQPGSPE
ncbi:MAG: SPFH domain-containing protein [Pseudomonadota bacterium]